MDVPPSAARAAPALLGLTRGDDSIPGIGDRELSEALVFEDERLALGDGFARPTESWAQER